MPPKEGERGRDQHLAVETLPPRVIICTRKTKAVGKRWLSWLGAVEAGGSVKGECGVRGPSSTTLTYSRSHTRTCFHLRERVPSHVGWRAWAGRPVDRLRAQDRDARAGLL